MVYVSNGLSLHSGTTSIQTETDQLFHNPCLWCSQWCRSIFPSLRILLAYVVPFRMSCDPHALSVKVFVTSDRGERALVALYKDNHQSPAYYTSGYREAACKLGNPCFAMIFYWAHLALPSHLSFLVSPETGCTPSVPRPW